MRKGVEFKVNYYLRVREVNILEKAVGKIQVMKWLSELLFNFRLLDFESAFKDILKSHTPEAIMK